MERSDNPAANGRHSGESRVWGVPIHRLRGVKVAAGDLDAIAFIQGMSPVAWQHVNMFGSFEFSDEAPDVDMEALV